MFHCGQTRLRLVQILDCHLFSAKPLSELMLLIGPLGTHFDQIAIKIQIFILIKSYMITSFAKWWPFRLNHKASNVDCEHPSNIVA